MRIAKFGLDIQIDKDILISKLLGLNKKGGISQVLMDKFQFILTN